MSDVHSISDAVSETGGIDSDGYMMYDLCTCGSNLLDYVSVHSRSSHLPCRVVGEFDGRYQLYCSKGVLDTTFSRAEVIPMATCTPIPMEEW